MTGSSPQASKQADQSRFPCSMKCWRPAASDSTPSMSKITAGPTGCATPSPARQRQLGGTSSEGSPGTKDQLTGPRPIPWAENPPQDGRGEASIGETIDGA